MGRRKKLVVTDEDKLLKKRIAERNRYKMIKNDPHLYELQRIKDREKYERKKLLLKGMTTAQRIAKKGMKKAKPQNFRNKKSMQVRQQSSDSSENDDEMKSEIELYYSESEEKFEPAVHDNSTYGTAFDLLAEFQADEELEFAAARRLNNVNTDINTSPIKNNIKPAMRVAASAPPPLPPSANPLMWLEEPVPRLRPGANADESQIFGDFVASELRTLRSDASRKKLKRMIQKAILQIGEAEDVNIISG